MKESCRNIKGFTLVELIVVMAVFLVIITVAAQTFNTIITNSVKYSKSEESNIEGVMVWKSCAMTLNKWVSACRGSSKMVQP